MKQTHFCATCNVQRATRCTLHIARCTLNKLLIIGVLIILATPVVRAQEEGGIEAVEIEIVKEKQITMPKASRNFEKVPPRPADPLAPSMTYDFKTLNFTAPDYNPVVKPLRLKDETLSKIYGNYLSAGFGNYKSPFLRASLSSKRNAEKAYGVDFFHHSFGTGPVDKEMSGMGYTKVNGYLSGMGPKITSNVGLTYENMFNHYYGYAEGAKPTDESNIRQSYNIIGLNAGITNTKTSDLNYNLSGDFSYLKDRFDAVESEVGLHLNTKYQVNKTQAFALKGEYILIARKDNAIEPKPRHLFKVNPAYQFNILDERFRLSVGLNAVVENDTVGKDKPIHIYPDAWIYSKLAKNIEAYAGITGDVEKVSLHTLARENQWLDNNINIFHTNKSFEFRVGVQGKVARKVSFHVGTSIINYKNLYFYQNLYGASPAESHHANSFVVVYDDAVRLNLFAELGVVHADKVNISFRGDYYSYSMKHLQYPWQRPTNKIGIYSSFKIVDKMLLTVDLQSQGGAKAYDGDKDQVISLKPAMNLNTKLRYFISKPLSVFVEVNNALNNKYPIYYMYPARGIQVSAGVSWSF
jgi:hypothetical protein